MLLQLEDFAWGAEVAWEETLAISSGDAGVPTEIDVNDDIKRETIFHDQALAAVHRGLSLLTERGIPFRRPDDYYAEMVKSDDHMGRIKERLLLEKAQIEQKEERRQKAMMKKFGKQVQAEKLKDRSMKKKAEIDTISKWRKQRQNSGFENDETAELPVRKLLFKIHLN